MKSLMRQEVSIERNLVVGSARAISWSMSAAGVERTANQARGHRPLDEWSPPKIESIDKKPRQSR
jgi:hypothetical protein